MSVTDKIEEAACVMDGAHSVLGLILNALEDINLNHHPYGLDTNIKALYAAFNIYCEVEDLLHECINELYEDKKKVRRSGQRKNNLSTIYQIFMEVSNEIKI